MQILEMCMCHYMSNAVGVKRSVMSNILDYDYSGARYGRSGSGRPDAAAIRPSQTPGARARCCRGLRVRPAPRRAASEGEDAQPRAKVRAVCRGAGATASIRAPAQRTPPPGKEQRLGAVERGPRRHAAPAGADVRLVPGRLRGWSHKVGLGPGRSTRPIRRGRGRARDPRDLPVLLAATAPHAAAGKAAPQGSLSPIRAQARWRTRAVLPIRNASGACARPRREPGRYHDHDPPDLTAGGRRFGWPRASAWTARR